MSSVEERLAGRLLADPAVTAVLGRRVYPDDLPAHLPPGPRAEIDLTAEEPSDRLDGRGGGPFAAVVTVYARTKALASAARRRVRKSLDGWAGGVVSGCWWEGTSAVETEAGFAYSLNFAGQAEGPADSADAAYWTADDTTTTADGA